MTKLWDKNGIVCFRPEDEVEAFVKQYAHREFGTEERPIVLGCSKAVARGRFIRNRVKSLRRRWKHKHERTLEDAMANGKAQAEAAAEADAKWGADPPTLEAIAKELEPDIPKHLREEEA